MPGEDPIKHLKDFDVICATTGRTGGDEDAVKAFAFDKLLGKLKIFKKILHHHKMRTHSSNLAEVRTNHDHHLQDFNFA
ncbi:hypothetical protein PIB30_066669 [Stylosanthes scabra]|uniref:Uncharacterized protein n=1 Tax=Stylosanthes scabra TaxID=79078 RepID=A0ABU6WMC1_9FABA|nr:hypothetical protein [Stylosanthes scabra]